MINELNENIIQALNKYYECFDDETWELIVSDEEFAKIEKELEEYQNKKDDLKTWALQQKTNLDASINWIDLEIKRLTELKESQTKKLNQNENFIKFLFWKLDKPIVFWNYKIWYRKSESTIIEDKTLIPSKFIVIETKTTEKIPLAEIKKAIENWEIVPWAKIQENLNFYIK